MSFARVLVPLSSSGLCGSVFEAAVDAIDRWDGRVRLVHVRTWQTLVSSSKEEQAYQGPDSVVFTESSDHADDLLGKALTGFSELGVAAESVVMEAPRPMVGSAIVSAAAGWNADVVVLTRRRRHRLSLLLSGSVSEQVMHEACCPVLVVEGRPAGAHRPGIG